MGAEHQTIRKADVIFVNGQITTLDARRPQVEAVAVKAGKFMAIGTVAEIKEFADADARVIDLEGQRVIPGLIDAHCHPVETLWLKDDWIDARYPGTDSVASTLKKLADRVKKAKKAEWILIACASATQNKFAERRLPSKAELDQVSPDNPVMLANGAHMSIVNTKALENLGITNGQSKLPKGGNVMLNNEGEATGVITDGFADLPSAPESGQVARYYTHGIPEFWNRNGFTSLLAITPHQVVPILQAVSEEVNQPDIRYTISVWKTPDGAELPEDLHVFGMPEQADPNYFRFAGIKAWIDGENDCRTGYMYQPYVGHVEADPAGGRGSLVTPQGKANNFVDLAHKNHCLAMLHCSGDAAVDIGLTAYEKSIKADRLPTTIRRIEHYGMFQLNETQLERAKNLKRDGFHISVQPIWLTELVKADYENMGPERARTGYRFNTLIAAGLEPAASTDMTGIYLGNIDPFKAIHAMVTRQSDIGVFEPQEAISVQDAVRMWTIWPAKAIGESEHRGTIEIGKVADMTVLTEDIFAIPPEQLENVQASKTIVGGRVVYRQ